MKSNKYPAVFQAMLAFGLWSSLGIFFNRVTLPTSVYVVFGSLIGLCVLYGYFYLTNRNIPRFTFSWWLVGLFSVAAIKGVIWFRALALIPVAKAMLIHNLAPVVALLAAPVFIREKPHFNHFIAAATGFLGLATLLKLDATNGILTLGAFFSMGAALASGLQDVCQRRLAKTLSGNAQAFVFILGQAVGSILFLMPDFPRTISWLDFSHILFFGIVGTALPIILLSRSFAGLKSFEVSILGYTEPALGALWAALFLNQPILPSTAIGGLLIFLSGLTAIKEETNIQSTKR